jgi:hypothetical protein
MEDQWAAMYTATSTSTAAAIFAAPRGQDWFEDTLRRIEQPMSAKFGKAIICGSPG